MGMPPKATDRSLLITGATGNIGTETIRALRELSTTHRVVAATHRPDRARERLPAFEDLDVRRLDFADPSAFPGALAGIDVVFLLRPPQLADIPRYFQPFLAAMAAAGIRRIVFLSVQGVEEQPRIPHHKLEKLIRDHDLDYVFLRPGYFMQNLSTMLLPEIKAENKIFIPAGNLKFNWVDVRDIGAVAAHVLTNFEQHRNRAYELTGTEFLDFQAVAGLLSQQLDRPIRYESPNLLRFYFAKRRQGIPHAMIFVMIMLHYLPRFGKNQPRLTDTVENITGQAPGTLAAFIDREKNKFG